MPRVSLWSAVLVVVCVRVSGLERDPYKVLGVSRDANQATIKKAWKKLAAANHPDKIGRDSDDSVFVEASEAYRILSDPNELREWQIKQNEFGDGGFHRQHQRRWHQQQQQQQYMHQQQYMRQQHREWYEQQQRQRFVAEHPFGEHRSRAYLEPRTVEQLATFAGSQRPVLTMYLVPHGTYIRPDMWKALTDPLVGTGVEIGVVDAGFSPGAFLSHRVGTPTIRGYYRGRVCAGPVLDKRPSKSDIENFIFRWLAGSGRRTGGWIKPWTWVPECGPSIVDEFFATVSEAEAWSAVLTPATPRLLVVTTQFEAQSIKAAVLLAMIRNLQAHHVRVGLLELPANSQGFQVRNGIASLPAGVVYVGAKRLVTLNSHSLEPKKIREMFSKFAQLTPPALAKGQKAFNNGWTEYVPSYFDYFSAFASWTCACAEVTDIITWVTILALSVLLVLISAESLAVQPPKSSAKADLEARKSRNARLVAQQAVTALLNSVCNQKEPSLRPIAPMPKERKVTDLTPLQMRAENGVMFILCRSGPRPQVATVSDEGDQRHHVKGVTVADAVFFEAARRLVGTRLVWCDVNPAKLTEGVDEARRNNTQPTDRESEDAVGTSLCSNYSDRYIRSCRWLLQTLEGLPPKVISGDDSVNATTFSDIREGRIDGTIVITCPLKVIAVAASRERVSVAQYVADAPILRASLTGQNWRMDAEDHHKLLVEADRLTQWVERIVDGSLPRATVTEGRRKVSAKQLSKVHSSDDQTSETLNSDE